MTISISKEFDKRLSNSLEVWKAGRTRDRIRSIVLDLLRIQRESPIRGKRNQNGEDIVFVSSDLVRELLPNSQTRSKFWKWIDSSHLIKKDGSWISVGLGKSINKDARCNGWHIVEPELSILNPKTVKAEYDPELAIYGRYKETIIKAEGKLVDGEIFHGAWAIPAYDSGMIEWPDFREVAKIARFVLKGTKNNSDKPSCRTYGTITMSKKTLREKCFSDPQTGRGMVEVFDIAGAITTTGPYGAAYFNGERFEDGGILNWADSLANGKIADPYRRIWDGVFRIAPNTRLYGAKPTWNKTTRKSVKMDMQVVTNASPSYIKKCQQAYDDHSKGIQTPRNLRRQWLVWQSVRMVMPTLFECLLRCKANGTRDSFYRLHTFGELMLMEALVDFFTKQGIRVHRVHDAIWSTDATLIAAGKTEVAKCVGQFIGAMFRKGGFNFFEQYVPQEVADWVRDGFTVSDSTESKIVDVMAFTNNQKSA